jgi:hypothetical protein
MYAATKTKPNIIQFARRGAFHKLHTTWHDMCRGNRAPCQILYSTVDRTRHYRQCHQRGQGPEPKKQPLGLTRNGTAKTGRSANRYLSQLRYTALVKPLTADSGKLSFRAGVVFEGFFTTALQGYNRRSIRYTTRKGRIHLRHRALRVHVPST